MGWKMDKCVQCYDDIQLMTLGRECARCGKFVCSVCVNETHREDCGRL
jgi:hypothetical protein